MVFFFKERSKILYQTKIITCVEFRNLCAAKVGAVALGEACTPADGSKGNCDDANAICPSGTATCECNNGYTAFSEVCGECILRSEMFQTEHFKTLNPLFVDLL